MSDASGCRLVSRAICLAVALSRSVGSELCHAKPSVNTAAHPQTCSLQQCGGAEEGQRGKKLVLTVASSKKML